MIVFAGAALVRPDRILSAGSLLVDDGRIVAIDPRPHVEPAGAEIIDVRDCYIVPGFVDVHVHGVEGDDTLDPGEAIASIASKLPRDGGTAVCPATGAGAPDDLRRGLRMGRDGRAWPH